MKGCGMKMTLRQRRSGTNGGIKGRRCRRTLKILIEDSSKSVCPGDSPTYLSVDVA